MSATLSVSPAPSPPAAQSVSAAPAVPAGGATAGEPSGGFGGVLARLADTAGSDAAPSQNDRAGRKVAAKDAQAGAPDGAADDDANAADANTVPNAGLGGLMLILPPATPQPQSAAPTSTEGASGSPAPASAALPGADPKMLLPPAALVPEAPPAAADAASPTFAELAKAPPPPSAAEPARPLAAAAPPAPAADPAPAPAAPEAVPVAATVLAASARPEPAPAARTSSPAAPLSETSTPATTPVGKGETVLPSAAQTAASANAGGGDLSGQGGDTPSGGDKALAPKVEAAVTSGAGPDTTGQPAVAGPAAAQAHTAATAPAATPQTVAHLAAQIVARAGGARTTQFDVALDPQGLGRVNVSLRIAADGTMSAAMSFDTPQAAAELRARSDELQRALTQAGFNVADGALTFDVAGDSARQGRGQNARSLFDFAGGLAGPGLPADTPPTGAQLIAAYRASRAGGVDIRI